MPVVIIREVDKAISNKPHRISTVNLNRRPVAPAISVVTATSS